MWPLKKVIGTDYNPLDKIENHVHAEANKHTNEYGKSFMKSGYLHGFKVTPHKWPASSSTLKITKGWEWGKECTQPHSVKNLKYNFWIYSWFFPPAPSDWINPRSKTVFSPCGKETAVGIVKILFQSQVGWILREETVDMKDRLYLLKKKHFTWKWTHAGQAHVA